MPEFLTVGDAKNYLAARIAVEAQHSGSPLSDVERKMLYFSETGWTLPDIAEVRTVFDRDCDQAEYEAKIIGLIRQVRATDRKHNSHNLAVWQEAVQKIQDEDHYLLVMLNQANAPKRSWAHAGRLVLIAFVVACIALAILWGALIH